MKFRWKSSSADATDPETSDILSTSPPPHHSPSLYPRSRAEAVSRLKRRQVSSSSLSFSVQLMHLFNLITDTDQKFFIPFRDERSDILFPRFPTLLLFPSSSKRKMQGLSIWTRMKEKRGEKDQLFVGSSREWLVIRTNRNLKRAII